eukprot:1144395-Pleurochrysis_carterae.AAC.1
MRRDETSSASAAHKHAQSSTPGCISDACSAVRRVGARSERVRSRVCARASLLTMKLEQCSAPRDAACTPRCRSRCLRFCSCCRHDWRFVADGSACAICSERKHPFLAAGFDQRSALKSSLAMRYADKLPFHSRAGARGCMGGIPGPLCAWCC